MNIIGIIGGSGLSQIEGLLHTRRERIASPFGEPSDELLFGDLAGHAVVFLPRHGRGHSIPPSEINFRANIDALKRVGVTDIVSVSAVGSLRADLPPGTFVLVDQFIDRTHGRRSSFFGTGCVAHVSLAHPVCNRMGEHLAQTARALDIRHVQGGTYLTMDGPQFSTQAESHLYRQWGCDVIGMTNMPEAKLAREAEMCYTSVAMVTDYDCWHPQHDAVTVEQILAVLHQNADQARLLLQTVIPALSQDVAAATCRCRQALEHALITEPEARDPMLLSKLDAVAGRVLQR